MIKYDKTKWVDGTTVLRASHMEKIEKGITDIIDYNNSIYTDEDTRKSNEINRQNTFSNKISEVNDKITEINNFKENMTNTVSNKIDEVETRFNTLTSKQQQDSEVIDARAGAVSLKARLDNFDSQLEHKANKGNGELHVGVNQEFTSIQSAIANITPEKNIIIVHEGQYKEKIRLNEQNVIIKGVDRDLVTIWNDEGAYGCEPVLIGGGNVKISNINILSKYEDIGSSNGCYALHIDRSEDSNSSYPKSEIIIENCNITSYNHAGVGCGTENDQSLKFINCNISSYKNAGLLYHTSIVNMENQKFSLINCNLFSDTYFPLYLKNDTPNSSGFEVEFINNNLVGNNSYTQGTSNVNDILSSLTKNSYGNNDKKINYNSPNQIHQLTSDSGHAIEVTDFNNVTTGYFKGDGSKGCLNTPTEAWYIGYSVSYASDYIVQFAFAILDGFKMYTRFKTTVWSSWTECKVKLSEIQSLINKVQVSKLTQNDGSCMSITDLNNAIVCGYYSADGTKNALNCPTNDAVYIVQTISYSTTGFLVQYAWKVTGSNLYTKYKRGKDNGNWTSWKQISE